MPITILAISGSLRADSSNTAILRAAALLSPEGMRMDLYEGLGDLPHFSPEIDNDAPPDSVRSLRMLLGRADGAIICTPEYAYGMPGSLKNALDWTVSSGEFFGKPVAAISASPSAAGGERAQAWLLSTLTALGADIVQESSLTIPFVRTRLAQDGTLADPATATALRSALNALAGRIGAAAG